MSSQQPASAASKAGKKKRKQKKAAQKKQPPKQPQSLDEASARSLDDASSVRSSLSGDGESSYSSASDRGEEADDFSSDSEEEEESSYKPGGYHPVKVGEVYNGRFEVLEKLGWGHFSTVWKCLDRATRAIVAMKVQKSARHYTEAARDEIELLECAEAAAKKEEEAAKESGEVNRDPDTSHVVRLIDSFDHVGPNGTHVCMVFEMLGDNLLTLIKYYNYRGVPVRLVQRLTKDILSGLAFLHTKCQIIHTDLKPENVLLSHRIPRLPKLRKSQWLEFNRKRRANTDKPVAKISQPTASTGAGDAETSQLSKEEKKRLKNKLKKQRQKAKKQQQQVEQEPPVSISEREDKTEDEKLVASMENLAVSDVEDDAFQSNFGDNGEQDEQPQSDGCSSNKEWVHIPPEFAGRVMLWLPDGRVAGSKKKEIEFTLPAPSGVDTSCVLRHLDRIDQDLAASMEGKLRGAVSRVAASTSTEVAKVPSTTGCTTSNLRLWRLEFDARYTLSVFAFLEKNLDGVRFLNFSIENDIAVPGFFLPIKYATNGQCAVKNRDPVVETKGIGEVGNAATVIQGVNLRSFGWPETVPVKSLPHRLARWKFELDLIAAAKPFDIMALNAKVCDLGNACWTNKHFTDDIQTRQYRCPEVIVGKKYDTSADIWSMACFVFELVTGDLLFDPKSGRNFNRDDDHLAQMIELLGRMPKSITGSQRGAKEFFTRKGELKHIKSLKFWSLGDVLIEKYRFSPSEAESLASFLLPMLRYELPKRATAVECLAHPWASGNGQNASAGSDNDSDRGGW